LSSTELIAQPSHTPSEGHSTGSRLIQNAVSNVGGQVVVVLLTFFSTPYITRKLGAAQYGALSLLMTYLFAFSLLNLGINTSLVKYLAELLPKGRMSDIQGYVSTSLTVLVGIGVLIGAAVCVFAGPIVRIAFKGSAELLPLTILALRIASAAFVLQFLTQVVLSVPTAMQRFEIVNLVRASSEAVRIAGAVVLLWLGYGLPSLMGMVLAASLGGCIAYTIAAKKLLPELNIVPGFSRTHLGSLLRHSKYVVVANAGNQIVSAADVFLIGFFLPVANVAYYAIGYTLAQRMSIFVNNVVSVVFPAASSFAGEEQGAKIRELYLRGMKLCAIVGCFPALALSIFSRPFLLYWLGADYAREGALSLTLLTLGFLINSFSYVPYQVLQSTRHADIAAKAIAAYAILNVSLFLLLIPRFGIVGAAAGFLTAQLLFVPLFVQRANLLLGVEWIAVLRVSYLRPFLAASCAACLCWLCQPWVSSFSTLAVAVAIGFAIYALLVPIAVLDSGERAACLLLLNRWIVNLGLRKSGAPTEAAING
jgi:O-antigen/teichoic acid export membrane protein